MNTTASNDIAAAVQPEAGCTCQARARVATFLVGVLFLLGIIALLKTILR